MPPKIGGTALGARPLSDRSCRQAIIVQRQGLLIGGPRLEARDPVLDPWQILPQIRHAEPFNAVDDRRSRDVGEGIAVTGEPQRSRKGLLHMFKGSGKPAP